MICVFLCLYNLWVYLFQKKNIALCSQLIIWFTTKRSFLGMFPYVLIDCKEEIIKIWCIISRTFLSFSFIHIIDVKIIEDEWFLTLNSLRPFITTNIAYSLSHTYLQSSLKVLGRFHQQHFAQKTKLLCVLKGI